MIAGLISAGVAAAITMPILVHLDHEYGPVQLAPFGGVYSGRDLTFSHHDTLAILSAQRGAQAQLVTGLDNLGTHSVSITSISWTDDVTQNVQWSVYRSTGNVTGRSTPWHSFPAVIPAQGRIRILITIARPQDCQGRRVRPNMGGFYPGEIVVHWSSLLHDHSGTIDAGFNGDFNGYAIQVC